MHVAGDPGIPRARRWLGCEPVKRSHDELAGPVAEAATRGDGTGGDGQRALTAARWTWRTRRATTPGSGSRRRAGAQRVPEVALRGAGRRGYARADWIARGPVRLRRNGAGRAGGQEAGRGNHLLGGSQCLRVQDVDQGVGDRCGSCMENQVLPRDRYLGGGSYLSRVSASQRDRQRTLGGRAGAGRGSIAWRDRERGAAAPSSDDPAGPGAGAGRPVPRAPGDRDGLGRTEDAS